MENQSLISYLNDTGQAIVAELQANLDKKGLTNTGKTKQSIRYEVKQELDKLILNVYGNSNLGSLQFGAKPITGRTDGMFVKSITEWAKSKLGLPEKEAKGLAYGYLKKRLGSGKSGPTTKPDGSYFVPNRYNPGGVLSDTINDNRIKSISEEITKLSAESFVRALALTNLL